MYNFYGDEDSDDYGSDPSEPGRMLDPVLARIYILAGRALVTLRSKRTGVRFTYKISRSKKAQPGKDPVHFVGVLTGPDNTNDYSFIGTIFSDGRYVHSRNNARVPAEAPSAKAWAWSWAYLSRAIIPDGLEVWHEGRCGVCGRALTDPESIRSGIGPVCAGK